MELVPEPSGRTMCRQCMQTIEQGQLRLLRPNLGGHLKGYKYLHLQCYGTSEPIKEEHFSNVFYLSNENQQILRIFIQEHNGRIKKRKIESVPDHQKNERAVKKIKITALNDELVWAIDTDSLITALPNEIILPILQLLEVRDISSLAQVSKRMLVIAEDDAVWQPRAKTTWKFKKESNQSWKKFYIYAYQNACVACKKLTEQKHFFWPLLKRLCFKCRDEPAYSMIDARGLQHGWAVDLDDVKNAGLRSQNIVKTSARRWGKGNNFSNCKMYLESQIRGLHQMKIAGKLTQEVLAEMKLESDRQLERARSNYKFRTERPNKNQEKEDENDGEYIGSV